MNIVLIGASGFVGTRLINVLKDCKHQITNIDIAGSEYHPEITIYGDVRDRNEITRLTKGADIIILLAAQHRDDVTPTSLYYDTNVNGMKNVLHAMEENGIKRLLFFSSVAIYGMGKCNPDEESSADPFNHYGKSKWQAETLAKEWHQKHQDTNINIIRPTVIFGERNRGNVYNLLNQISNKKFIMIGSGNNIKSMAYVGNVVSFAKFVIENIKDGYNVYNYVDKPDLNMNELVSIAYDTLNKKVPAHHIPYWMGMVGGLTFDLIATISHRKLNISSIRIKKFCSTTQFDSTKAQSTGFKPEYSLTEGLSETISHEFKNVTGNH